MTLDLYPLLVALSLIGLGLYLNRDRFREPLASRRHRRVTRQVQRWDDEGRYADIVALLSREADRLRRVGGANAAVRRADMLHQVVAKLNLLGRHAEAVAVAEEAVAVADGFADRYPQRAVRPSIALAQTYAFLGDDGRAALALRRADALTRTSQDHSPWADADRVICGANLSMVLRRIGEVPQALEAARYAIEVHDRIVPSSLPPYALTGVGWARTALALAMTDSGEDGRGGADAALATWQALVDQGIYPVDSDGYTYAAFAVAYAQLPYDTQAATAQAHRALDVFERLAAKEPGRFTRRVAEVRSLLEKLPAA